MKSCWTEMTLILCRTLALIGCARVPAVRTQRGDKRPEMSSGVGGASGHVIGASAAAPAHAPSSTPLAFPGSWHFQFPGICRFRERLRPGARRGRSAVCGALRFTAADLLCRTAQAARVFLIPLPGTGRARPPPPRGPRADSGVRRKASAPRNHTHAFHAHLRPSGNKHRLAERFGSFSSSLLPTFFFTATHCFPPKGPTALVTGCPDTSIPDEKSQHG